MTDAIFISDDLVASKSSITQKYTIWNTNTLQYDYNYKTQCIWRSNQIELAWEYNFKNTTTIWLQIQNSCISKSNQIESAWKYIHWALIVDEQWTPPIAMAQQTNKKTLHNIQEFSSIPFIKSSLEFCLFFHMVLKFHVNWTPLESFSTWNPLLPSSWNYLKLYIWNNFRLFPFEFQFILRLSERNGTWKNFPSSLFPLQPPHHPSRPSAPPTTPTTCPPPPCQPSPSPCPPPGPPPPCSTWSSSSPACLSARHLPPHPSTVTPPSRGGLAHIHHIILKR